MQVSSTEPLFPFPENQEQPKRNGFLDHPKMMPDQLSVIFPIDRRTLLNFKSTLNLISIPGYPDDINQGYCFEHLLGKIHWG